MPDRYDALWRVQRHRISVCHDAVHGDLGLQGPSVVVAASLGMPAQPLDPPHHDRRNPQEFHGKVTDDAVVGGVGGDGDGADVQCCGGAALYDAFRARLVAVVSVLLLCAECRSVALCTAARLVGAASLPRPGDRRSLLLLPHRTP